MNTTLLSAPVGEDGEDSLIDLLADKNAVDPQEEACDMVLCKVIRETVREEVARLPVMQREAIEGCYFRNETLQVTADRRGVSREAVRQQKAAGVRRLGRMRSLSLLWEEYTGAAEIRQSHKSWRNTHTSAVELAAIIREQMARRLRNAV